VISLEVFGAREKMTAVAELLDGDADASRVRLVEATQDGYAVVSATVQPQAADELVGNLRRLGVSDPDITLTSVEVLGRSSAQGVEAGLVWEDVLGMAARNSRPIARYFAFMLGAGAIASYGVIDYNGILIVGAMAVSPDLLPITAIAVGLVDRKWRLARRAILTFVLGMACASFASAVLAFAQDHLDLIPSGFNLDSTILGSLTTVNNETIVVALVAGVVGMLALETRASSGVGVAISVTTIPAAAYLGVAVGLGDAGNARGALEVLSANLAMLVVGASGTLLLQRSIARRGQRGAARRLRNPRIHPDWAMRPPGPRVESRGRSS
jgi:uncharacterized hydrophobic protein (TIGR00271 family)